MRFAGNATRSLTVVLGLLWAGRAVEAATSCSAASLAALLPAGSITLAQDVAATATTPAHCRVEGTMPTHDNTLRFRLVLPAQWNGKFLFEGVGGLVGVLLPLDAGLARGYAVATTDTGHIASINDVSWALGAPEKKIDWAHRAVHVATAGAKTLVTGYYGKAIAKAYFRGCSNGGRAGLVEAQRYPQDYDGIIAGAPALDIVADTLGWAWNAQALLQNPQGTLTPQDWDLIGKTIRDSCDALDGEADGVIEDPRRCELPLAKLRCGVGQPVGCLGEPKLLALGRIWHKPALADGTRLMPEGIGYEDDPRVWMWYAQVHPQGGNDFLRYLYLDDANGGIAHFDVVREGAALLHRWSGVFDASNPDLSPYIGRGSRLLMWHGWADAALPPLGTIDYYWRARSVVQQRGLTAQAFDDSVRLYMIPAMSHCTFDIGPSDDQLLGVLEDWVEKGRTPQSLQIDLRKVSAPAQNGRPLCPLPQVARRGADRGYHCQAAE